MPKRKTIKFETIKKAFGDAGDMFEKDLIELHAKINAFTLKYGRLGIKTLMSALKQQ